MKFFKSRALATVVLVLVIIGASIYGFSKRPAELPAVEYYQWVHDKENLLTASTEDMIEKYNTSWNDKYYAVIAVAAVENIRGWNVEDFVYDLGERWGLGANDMLLLIVEDDDYYVGLGDNLLSTMTDTQQSKLQAAIDADYYKGDFDAAVVSFFRQADVFYAQALGQQSNSMGTDWIGSSGGSDRVGLSIFGIILVVALVFLIWAALDKVRYNRYQRRVIVTPGIPYYPIFWGRPHRPVAPVRPVQPTRPSGGYTPPRTNQRTTTVHRNTTSRPSGRNSFGNGGFGGGSRGGSRGSSSRGGFGGRR